MSTWIVASNESSGIDVFEADTVAAYAGEVSFDNEVAALEYGLACAIDRRDVNRRSIAFIRRQLRKAKP